MASNFHSELPNSQIHNPKDYSKANNSSVLTKSNAGALDWKTSPYGTSTTITCGADVAGGLHEKTFYIYLDSANKAECYFNVSGETVTHIATPGYLQVKIDIVANNDAIQVARFIHDELAIQTGAWTALTVSFSGTGKVTFSGMTNSPDTLDGDTNFFFENTKTYTGTTVLTSTAGVMDWLPGGGGGGTSNQMTTTSFRGYTNNKTGGAINWRGFRTQDNTMSTDFGTASSIDFDALWVYLIPATRHVVTSATPSLIKFVGQIICNTSVTAEISLWKGRPLCAGSNKCTLKLIHNESKTLLTGVYQCFDVTLTEPLIKGDIIVPLIKSSGSGVVDYATTLRFEQT